MPGGTEPDPEPDPPNESRRDARPMPVPKPAVAWADAIESVVMESPGTGPSIAVSSALFFARAALSAVAKPFGPEILDLEIDFEMLLPDLEGVGGSEGEEPLGRRVFLVVGAARFFFAPSFVFSLMNDNVNRRFHWLGKTNSHK